MSNAYPFHQPRRNPRRAKLIQWFGLQASVVKNAAVGGDRIAFWRPTRLPGRPVVLIRGVLSPLTGLVPGSRLSTPTTRSAHWRFPTLRPPSDSQGLGLSEGIGLLG